LVPGRKTNAGNNFVYAAVKNKKNVCFVVFLGKTGNDDGIMRRSKVQFGRSRYQG
jgi:hypothetical protein